MTSEKARLVADHVTVRFGDHLALDGIDVGVGEGAILALLGPSGCGKTTLLRVIAGLERPERGTVSWRGRDLASLAPHERDVGLMFQDHALFPHRDVTGNVAFGLRMQRVAPDETSRRVGEVLELVGLSGYGSRRIDQLSGGEAQRVALARAIAPRPSILLLDEPLGSLDRKLRDRLAVEIRAIVKELGVTAIHVTHDHDEAFTVADRLAVMAAGRLLREGRPFDVRARPGDVFTARFLGLENVIEHVSGPLATVAPGRPGPVVVLPEAIRMVDSGGLVATASDARFRGDRFLVDCRLSDGTRLTVSSLSEPREGAEVRLAVDPGGIVDLAPA